MFTAIFNEIKNAFIAVKKGNEYRAAKYPPNPISSRGQAQAYNKWYRENLKPKALSMFATREELQEIDKFKAKFHYWDEWSGGRFIRAENPDYLRSKTNITPGSVWRFILTENPYYLRSKTDITPGSVCRSIPSTGYYEAVGY